VVLRLGCDIGGTFTDFVLLDVDSGELEFSKVLTTPSDPSEAVDQGVASIDGRRPGFLEATDHVIHGTTLVINALIQRSGARTALVTTKGFRDVLAMRREARYDTYDITARYPLPLVTRDLRFEVTERVYADGSIAEPLDVDEARRVLDDLVAQGIESVAVCFLHSYANATNERAFADLAAEHCPGITLSLSSEVLPEIQEYPRTCTTVVNAFVKPLIGQYLGRLDERLAARAFDRGLYLMLSGGGVVSADTARQFPVRLVESGPVGGALAAAYIGGIAGLSELLSFDMGGTTAKACYIRDGRLPITTEFEVDRVHRFKKGSGTPIAAPTVNVIEIGAGGGSIAQVNDLGLVQVGPQSAGADPGPICYGLGGEQPTVTDADLVLGYLNPTFFLGGEMGLRLQEAYDGIRQAIAEPLNLTVEQAAWGIHEVVNENMAGAARYHIAEHGGDAGTATMVAFGGAGPLHAVEVARKLGIGKVLVPVGAGVFSALGFVVAPISYEVSRTQVTPLDGMTEDAFESMFKELEAEGIAIVSAAQHGAELVCTRALDMCYRGQGSNIRFEISGGSEGDVPFNAIAERFADEYRGRYGYAYDDLEPQVRTLRVIVSAKADQPTLELKFSGEPGDTAGAHCGTRMAYSVPDATSKEHDVYRLDRLGDNAELEGPAIVEAPDSTLILGPGTTAVADARGWLHVTIG
jgi:N-methylhydantoinase A